MASTVADSAMILMIAAAMADSGWRYCLVRARARARRVRIEVQKKSGRPTRGRSGSKLITFGDRAVDGVSLTEAARGRAAQGGA